MLRSARKTHQNKTVVSETVSSTYVNKKNDKTSYPPGKTVSEPFNANKPRGRFFMSTLVCLCFDLTHICSSDDSLVS